MAVGFRHAVGQFSVLNLFYGPKFQKQMPILQLYISLLWKRFRESYKKSFNLEDLIVDFLVQHFNLCYFVNKANEETES